MHCFERRRARGGLAAVVHRLARIIGLPARSDETRMPYYLRVLTPSEAIVPAATLAGQVVPARLSVTVGSDEAWDELMIAHADGREIALVERNVVAPGSVAAAELAEFVEDLADARPATGAAWVREYLQRVRAVYAIQVLGGARHAGGWDAIGAVKNKLWGRLDGIIQADGEGFTNEDGYHAVWQFSDKASGPWWMGVLEDGDWRHFQMDLGDRTQREHFLRGGVPPGAPLAT